MTALFYAHSGFRYVVLLLGVATVLFALYGVATRKPVGRPMHALASAFAGTFHLQILLGLAVIFTSTFSSIVIGHVITMIFAAACAQIVPSVMRRRPPAERTHIPYLVGSLLAVGLAAAGIMALGRPIVG
jgi:hypothetical protein